MQLGAYVAIAVFVTMLLLVYHLIDTKARQAYGREYMWTAIGVVVVGISAFALVGAASGVKTGVKTG